MRRDEVVRLLRALPKLRWELARMEAALERLTEDEREIIDKMLVNPVPYASDKLCEMFDIEVAAVYRRRNKALQKLGNFLQELR